MYVEICPAVLKSIMLEFQRKCTSNLKKILCQYNEEKIRSNKIQAIVSRK